MEDKTYINGTVRRGSVDYLQYHITDNTKNKDFFDIVTARKIFDDYPDCNDTMHCHDFNLIFWMRGSRGTHIVDFTEYKIGES